MYRFPRFTSSLGKLQITVNHSPMANPPDHIVNHTHKQQVPLSIEITPAHIAVVLLSARLIGAEVFRQL